MWWREGEKGSKGYGKIWKFRFGTVEWEMELGEDYWGIVEKNVREEVYLEERRRKDFI